ncbi:hypothetical protein ATN84_13415 [Paramesorhizobium deserti]|uniref:DUF2865 domain-containing protein n=1 Tax=Paramesorhizobium deserti TaxID=1494590 RepID=A0A135HUY6_9HYPH|nr:DUF2865 domain-containing protein [Paramesorhizobium deserti]KXF76981.1 hypothetical protein ATN84_13415 [Paramesorhizobium deserti]
MIAMASLTIGAVAVSTSDGKAASAVCAKLQRQLTSASGGRSRSASSPAIRQLQGQVTRARIAARQAGCTGGLFSRPSSSPQCTSINASIDRLLGRIAELKQGGGGGGADRQRILAALNANDCNAPQRSRGLLTKLFGGSKAREVVEESAPARAAPLASRTRVSKKVSTTVSRSARDNERAPVKRRSQNVAATNEGAAPMRSYTVKSGYRTLCVRTCDGYYFPISFSTQRKYFARDEKACSAMCPGTEVKLYYHDVKDEESEDMVSVDTNMPYAALPAAFDYRTLGTRTPSGCTCQAPQQSTPFGDLSAQDQSSPGTGNFTMLGYSAGQKAAADKMSTFIGIPRQRPDPAADPETMLNTEGGLNRGDLLRLTEKDSSVVTSSTGAKIRVVGPTFLPDPKQAKGLRVPGQPEAR